MPAIIVKIIPVNIRFIFFLRFFQQHQRDEAGAHFFSYQVPVRIPWTYIAILSGCPPFIALPTY
jgi:heme/copper-type cytochrome/quinol oxidase subunit 2